MQDATSHGLRTLINVPILHTEIDMGSMGPRFRERFIAVFGPAAWSQRHSVVDAMWRGIERQLLDQELSLARVRLYQDGLPVCDHEKQIVIGLAEQGSPNHKLLVFLMERGATLMGTEEPQLLLAEYQRLQRLEALSGQRGPTAAARLLEREGRLLLQKRDRFVAQRIEQTLQPGETAVLLMGVMHHVDAYIPEDFEIRQLVHNVPSTYPHNAKSGSYG